jgi:hypothetical protein
MARAIQAVCGDPVCLDRSIYQSNQECLLRGAPISMCANRMFSLAKIDRKRKGTLGLRLS